ncbi:RNA polymerase sigma factor [Flavilitoribacter nigricans]|uniref:RNA polymerase sigma factor n=1 Tax=Flavilitoribacter nigricans TaxID=70997 RepID=UPI0014757AE7|nr:RNA polymerase sigma factor [Flavilitoribacter nigricans]
MTGKQDNDQRPNSAELEEILSGCRAEDSRAQKQLYERYYAYGIAVCLHYGSNREEAEEMLHNGFIRVFENIGQYRGDSSFKSWFRTVIVRSAITYYNRVQKRKNRFTLIRRQWRQEEDKNLALKILEEEDVYLLLQLLTPSYRMALSLFYLEAYTHREIAELLRISEGTSKSNLFKAKRKLAELIEAHYPREYECFKD